MNHHTSKAILLAPDVPPAAGMQHAHSNDTTHRNHLCGPAELSAAGLQGASAAGTPTSGRQVVLLMTIESHPLLGSLAELLAMCSVLNRHLDRLSVCSLR
jgi:hypothetical protein